MSIMDFELKNGKGWAVNAVTIHDILEASDGLCEVATDRCPNGVEVKGDYRDLAATWWATMGLMMVGDIEEDEDECEG